VELLLVSWLLLLVPRLWLELLFLLQALPLRLAWLLLFLLALLLGFFWLLPSSSLLNEHMGNCAIDRTAYIGGDLLLLQVFFEIFYRFCGRKYSFGTAQAIEGLPRGGFE
jgi:hypothetical protein